MATEFPIRANTSGAEQDIDKLIAKLGGLAKAAGLSQKEIDNITAATRKAKSEGGQNVDAISQGFEKINGLAAKGTELVAAYFAVDKLKDFIGEVVNITAEFQKFQAVLTNTLGSQGLAKSALADIQKLAQQTPFSVRELTENFIKLANRGVQPTMQQMTKLGDLAATLGKPFEQVVEALLDINNQERWKELGVHAQTAGDKVKLSFKGATVEVDRTVQGVTDAATKLGELEGVAGSMQAISETLGGQISNLGDSWDQFLNTVGDGNKGVFSGFIALANEAVQSMTRIMKTAEQLRTENAAGKFSNSKGYIDELISQGMSPEKAGAIEQANLERRIQEADQKLRKFQATFGHGDEIKELKEEIASYQEAYKTVQDYTESLIKQREAKANLKVAAVDEKKYLKELKYQWDQILAVLEKYDRIYKEHVKDIPKAGQIAVNTKGTPATSTEGANTEGGPLVTDDALAHYQDTKDAISAYDARQKALENFKNYSIQAMGELFAYNLQGIQNEMTALNNRYNYEMGLAGSNTDAKKKLQNDYNKQMLQLQNKQAEAQKQQAIFGIVVNQGPAIAKAIATAGFPINLGIGLVIAAMFAGILGQAKSVNVPRFKDGVFGLDGPGTETSDSIPAFLSAKESVVSAKKSKRFKDILQPMIEDPNFGYTDLRKIMDDKMPHLHAPLIVAPHVRDDGRLIDEIRDLKQTIKNKKEIHWNITEDGLSMLTQEKDQWTKYVNKRYKGSA